MARSWGKSPLRLAALVAVAAVCHGVNRADGATEDEFAPPAKRKEVPLLERQVPIPSYSPPVEANGCRARTSPSETNPNTGRQVPFWELVSDHVGKYAVELIVNQEKGREVFRQKLATADADTATLATLYALWQGLGADGLHTYFFMSGGAAAPDVLEALKTAGLKREAEIFANAMAAFGPEYPISNAEREKRFGYATGSELNAFDRRLMAIVKDFPSEAELASRVEAFVATRLELWRSIEARRSTLGNQRRLGILMQQLWHAANMDLPDERVPDVLAPFSHEERTLLALDMFNSEFENGGIHQFFFNSSGAYAPEVYEALKTVGLTRQAALFKRGMDMFRTPFPRNRQTRASSYIGRKDDEGFESELSELTDESYDGEVVTHLGGSTQINGGPGIRGGMERWAVQHNLLPC